MSENDKITEETANDTLPAEVETDLAEQETDVMPADPEEEEIAPEAGSGTGCSQIHP